MPLCIHCSLCLDNLVALLSLHHTVLLNDCCSVHPPHLCLHVGTERAYVLLQHSVVRIQGSLHRLRWACHLWPAHLMQNLGFRDGG